MGVTFFIVIKHFSYTFQVFIWFSGHILFHTLQVYFFFMSIYVYYDKNTFEQSITCLLPFCLSSDSHNSNIVLNDEYILILHLFLFKYQWQEYKNDIVNGSISKILDIFNFFRLRYFHYTCYSKNCVSKSLYIFSLTDASLSGPLVWVRRTLQIETNFSISTHVESPLIVIWPSVWVIFHQFRLSWLTAFLLFNLIFTVN